MPFKKSIQFFNFQKLTDEKKSSFRAIAAIYLFSCKKTALPQPTILSISPGQGAAYNYVTITGLNFDSVTSHITVSFNGVAGTVNAANDSVIEVIVPPGATTGRVTVTVNGQPVVSATDFVILPGTWTRKKDMPEPIPGDGRALVVGFSIGNYGYMGLGTDNGSDFDDLFRYDPATDTWSQMASMGLGMESAVVFVVNDRAYVGVGYSRQLEDQTNKLFEYDPSSNAWTPKTDFPGPKRSGAAAFVSGNFGMVGGGSPGDFYQYDRLNDSWTRKNDFTASSTITYLTTFVLNNNAYLVGETFLNPVTTQVWKYDATGDSWTRKNDIPAQSVIYPSTMVLNGNAYFMGGGIENWQYVESTDSWSQKAFFNARIAGATFVVGDKGFYGLGSGQPEYMNSDLWQFTP